MTAHNRKLKIITLDIDGSEFQAQLREWTLNNGTGDGETFYTYGGDAESFIEAAEAEFTLECTFFADWRSDGISSYLWAHDGETVTFQLDHHPDIVGEHVRWSGSLQIKAPSVGGEVRTTEETAVTFTIVGKPTFERVS